MCCHENRDTGVRQLAQQRAELVRSLGIETRERLVEQQSACVLGQRDGQPDFLTHSFRVSLDRQVRRGARELDSVEQRFEPGCVARALAGELREIVEVLDAGQRRVEADLLRNIGQLRAGDTRLARNFAAVDEGSAATRFEKAEEQVDRRRLAGAVGAEQALDFTWRDVQVECAQGPGVAEAPAQVLCFEHARTISPAAPRKSVG